MFIVLTVPAQTLVVGLIAKALKRGEIPTATPTPLYTDVAIPTPTVAAAAMSSSSSAQCNP
jgi:hypothetical protein